MGKKYFTLSFDDGLEQDKRIIALMKQYGLKGTFNLNSLLLSGLRRGCPAPLALLLCAA